MTKRIVAFLLCLTICFCVMPATVLARNTSFEETLAQDLKSLGLFYGVSDTDFALGRAPTRVEAMIMLIRLLGKSEEATSKNWSHPFTDVPDWASKYIGYAYEKGLTKGTSDTTFGTEDANAQMYLTFILRALGYSDANGLDFHWENPYELAEFAGILPSRVNRNSFWRADVVMVSYAALSAKLKNSSQTLAQKLIAENVFTKNQFDQYYDKDAFSKQPATQTEYNAEEIYDLCAPSVFYIEVYNKSGEVIASGSGFFIDDKGTAVTNYHVIDGAYSAKIHTDDDRIFSVEGVYDYDIDMDWAVIKINGSGFTPLEIGDKSTVVGGATVYAIGSPLGLQNTISQGLISNPNRNLDGIPYIQTSAAISHGSSGGALINKKGQVIGITSAGYEQGENLGLALPISLIENYNRSQVTSLAKIASEQETPVFSSSAYQALANFIDRNATYQTEDNENVYCETEYTEDGMVEIGLINCADYLVAYTDWQMDNGVCCFIGYTIDPNSSEPCVIYYTYEGSYVTVEGEAILSPANIYEGMYFRFDNFTGDYSGRGDHEDICSGSLLITLNFINLIFEEYFNGYSVYDLGFVNF